MSEHVAERYPRCPRCGSPLEGRNPYLPSYGRYECGSYERDDTATIECYRRQLAQAQAKVERLRRERASVISVLRDPTRSYSAKVITALDLFDAFGGDNDKEDGVDDVTHFALYHPDLNAWECQAEGCRFLWEFEDGNPYEHGMRFCPWCGRRIVKEAQQKHS